MTKTIKRDFLIRNFKILSGSVLKVIAVISMLIDHAAFLFYTELSFLHMSVFTFGNTDITVYYIMRKIGRLAFPLFCFLVAQGAVKTTNKRKYCLRLLLFAIISEIPFNLMLSGNYLYPGKQNVYFTLLLGVLIICAFDGIKDELKKFIAMAIILAVSILLRIDYGMYGVLLILLMYIFRNKPAVQAILSYPLLSGGVAAMCSFVPINMYNGNRGFVKSRCVKYLFYVFYPLHILILLAVKFLIK